MTTSRARRYSSPLARRTIRASSRRISGDEPVARRGVRAPCTTRAEPGRDTRPAQLRATTPNGAAADAERGTLLGMDTGIERERLLAGSITYAPIAGWLRPRRGFHHGAPASPNARSCSRRRWGSRQHQTIRRELTVRHEDDHAQHGGIDVAKAGAKYARASLAAPPGPVHPADRRLRDAEGS